MLIAQIRYSGSNSESKLMAVILNGLKKIKDSYGLLMCCKLQEVLDYLFVEIGTAFYGTLFFHSCPKACHFR